MDVYPKYEICKMLENYKMKVDNSRPRAWAFTRLKLIGYPQYLERRRRSKLSTFSFYAYLITKL